VTNPNDPFSSPDNSGGGGPALRTIGVGRLLVIVPLRIQRGVANPFQVGTTQSRLIADVLVCDGQPFMYGGDPTKGLPDNLGPFPVPGNIRGMWIHSDGIIDQIPEEKIGRGVILARLTKANTRSGRQVWKLDDPSAADKAIAAPIYQAYVAGQLSTPLPSPVAVPATAPMAQPYSPPPAAVVTDWTLTHPAPAGFEASWTGFTPAQRAQMLAMTGVTAGTAGPLVPAMAGDAPTY
jgi:hypothetical protein